MTQDTTQPAATGDERGKGFDWESASPRERDAWIARHVFGGPRDSWRFYEWRLDPDPEYTADGQKGMRAGNYIGPAFTADIEAAFGLGEKMKARGLAHAYARHLCDLLGVRLLTPDGQGDEDILADAFFVAHATPAQRAHAAYLALATERR